MESVSHEKYLIIPVSVFESARNKEEIREWMKSHEARDLSCAFASEQALAEDWLKPEEEEAWKHLQKARSS